MRGILFLKLPTDCKICLMEEETGNHRAYCKPLNLAAHFV